MNLSISWNVTAIAFTMSTLLSGFVAWRAFLIWRRQPSNQASETFFKILLFFTLYVGVRAGASLFLTSQPFLLTADYILSHIFLGIAAAYTMKFAMIEFFPPHRVNFIFSITLLLFGLDVGLNIFRPNTPYFDSALNIIHWGTDPMVGLFHTVLLWISFLSAAFTFMIKALKFWNDRIIRWRALLIALGLFFSIFIVVPRNIIQTPLMVLVSDIGFAISFFFVLWGVTFGKGYTEQPRL